MPNHGLIAKRNQQNKRSLSKNIAKFLKGQTNTRSTTSLFIKCILRYGVINLNFQKWICMFKRSKAPRPPETFGEFVRSLLLALLLMMSIQTVGYQIFNIPSGSMKPNLLIGDFLLVNKFTYGYTRYSIPFSPSLFQGRLFGSEPKRGDIVIFRAPHKTQGDNPFQRWMNTEDWVKRCVGLPGDRIQMRGGVLFINGQECPLKKMDTVYQDTLYINYESDGSQERVIDHPGVAIDRYEQTLPNGVKHIIIKEKSFGTARLDNTPEMIVPPGHYFVMGDNRDGSDDSRNQQVLGFVPYDHLLGRAELILFSTERRWWDVLYWLPGIRYDRLLSFVS